MESVRQDAALTIFEPAPRLSIDLRGEYDDAEIHLHAGGQGVWIARMARLLGASPELCGPFAGETGTVVHALLLEEGILVRSVSANVANPALIHRGKEADPESVLAQSAPGPLDRHELDSLYSSVLASALRTSLCVLAGVEPSDILDADTFRRMTTDLRSAGVTVVADLAGDQMRAAAEGGVDLLKVSDEELIEPGADVDDIRRAARDLHALGARQVVVSRAEAGAYVLASGGEECLLRGPTLEVVNPRGAGDAMTGALGAMLARGADRLTAIRTAVAASALNVTRHGMATGEPDAIARLSEEVTLERI